MGSPIFQPDGPSSAIVWLGKDKQVIRLVNARDFKIRFAFRVDSTCGEARSDLNVMPPKGSIEARDYVNITLTNINHTNVTSLRFIYWPDIGKVGRKFRSSVPIYLVNAADKSPETHRWFKICISAMRSAFLTAIVIYNIVLILQLSINK